VEKFERWRKGGVNNTNKRRRCPKGKDTSLEGLGICVGNQRCFSKGKISKETPDKGMFQRGKRRTRAPKNATLTGKTTKEGDLEKRRRRKCLLGKKEGPCL